MALWLHEACCVSIRSTRQYVSPMTPKLITNSSPRVAMAGMIVWYGRFPPLTLFGCPSRSVKFDPRFWRVNPHPVGIAPVPKPDDSLVGCCLVSTHRHSCSR
jgi:hypothetical protein